MQVWSLVAKRHRDLPKYAVSNNKNNHLSKPVVIAPGECRLRDNHYVECAIPQPTALISSGGGGRSVPPALGSQPGRPEVLAERC